MIRHRGPPLSRRTLLGAAGAALFTRALPDFAAAADAVRDQPLQIWFIRHAQSESNLMTNPAPAPAPNGSVAYPLTEKGIGQAKALAEALGNPPLLAIYSSTHLRAVQTADAIVFRHGLQLSPAPQAVSIDFGVQPDQDGDAVIAELLRKWVENKDIEARNGSGESYADVQRRFLPFVRELMNRHAQDSGVIAIVAHGGLLELMVPELAGNVSPSFALGHRLPNAGIIKTELRDSRLYCTEWAGMQIGEATR